MNARAYAVSGNPSATLAHVSPWRTAVMAFIAFVYGPFWLAWQAIKRPFTRRKRHADAQH